MRAKMASPQFHHPSRPLLLSLPLSVRRRIYLHLGVARWDGAPMLFDLAGPVDDPVEPVDPAGVLDLDLAGLGLASPVDPSTSGRLAFRGLLLSCRAIYAEASALLFSANQFVIHYRHGVERSLQPLRNLTASSLAALASVKIVLTKARVITGSPMETGSARAAVAPALGVIPVATANTQPATTARFRTATPQLGRCWANGSGQQNSCLWVFALEPWSSPWCATFTNEKRPI